MLTRKLTILAQDPSVRVNGKILRAEVEVPAEELAPGPWGYRVHVVDYDSSTGSLYRPIKYPSLKNGLGSNGDPFKKASDSQLLSNPNFHAQNAYAIVMRVLARFEFALGRRVSWGFYGHQIKVAPHAFADANAFYSEADQALMFGYFPGRERMVFCCLSHDIVAHETAHALLDGLRQRYTDPSSPEQGAFHEGFAEIDDCFHDARQGKDGKERNDIGDAQIENWSYALSKPAVKRILEGVDLYKVGHHGSRNATPKTLWNGFKKRFDKKGERLQTFCSTMAGKHGSATSKTEVPRRSLVDALKNESDYFTTQDLKKRDLCFEHTISFLKNGNKSRRRVG